MFVHGCDDDLMECVSLMIAFETVCAMTVLATLQQIHSILKTQFKPNANEMFNRFSSTSTFTLQLLHRKEFHEICACYEGIEFCKKLTWYSVFALADFVIFLQI